MKKSWPLFKLEIGITFIPFLIIILFSGYYKLFFTYFLINFIHELGHVITALLFRVRVDKMKLSIFGFQAEIENIDYQKIYKQVLIILMGPLTFFISLYLIKQLYIYDVISLVTYYKALAVNKYILIFNLLPIYPLDGGRIIKIILDKIFTYKVSKMVLYVISFIFMVGFVVYTNECKQYLMYVFLMINFVVNVLKVNKEWKRFLIKRYYFNNHYYKRLHSHRDLYVYNDNYLLLDRDILSEKEAISKLLGVTFF